MFQAPTSKKKSNAELRKFGLVMFVPLALLAGLFWWRKGLGLPAYGLGGAAGFFLLVGLLYPRLLGPIERVWMLLGGVMGWVMTRVILTLTFALAITPIALLMRLFRRDPLQMKLHKNATTYWSPTEEDGPSTRPYSPY